MSRVELESSTQAQVALKYLLGEIVLATWRPHCAVLTPVEFNRPDWPEAPEAMQGHWAPELDGLLCRKVDAERFPVGVGRYGSWLSYVRQKDVLYLVNASTPWEVYLKTFSTKARQNIQRAVRKYATRQGEAPHFQVCQTPEDIAWFHREAVRISQQTYQSRLLKAGLPDSAAFAAHLQGLAREGRARGYLLKDAGRPVAFAWCSLHGERLAYEVVGYLPELANWSPGTVLLYKILEQGFATQAFKLVDFGPGEGQYKSVFATDKLSYVDVFLFRASLKHRALIGLHRLLATASDGLVELLDRLGWKAAIKKWLRRR
jgi:CelD/BcsL family acetyltransferase involved in cellulose biosynthesis